MALVGKKDKKKTHKATLTASSDDIARSFSVPAAKSPPSPAELIS